MLKRRLPSLATMLLLLSLCSYAQTVGPVMPQIIARVNLTGQTNPIATTKLVNPTKDGLYRVSAVIVITTANNPPGGLWYVYLGFAPDTGPTTQGVFAANSSQIGGGLNSYSYTIRSNAGHPITYAVADNGGAQGSTYELFLILERLE